MKAEEGDPADLAEDGRQRGRCCPSTAIFIAIVVISVIGGQSYLCPHSCSPVSLLLHDCRDRLCRLQRLFLLPRSLPLRRRAHSHDSLLQAMLSIINYSTAFDPDPSKSSTTHYDCSDKSDYI